MQKSEGNRQQGEEAVTRTGRKSSMSKLGKHRYSGGDLDALLRASSHAIMLRYIFHILLCIAALTLGFSISREALLIVVSFRLPYGSFFVKTTTHAHGHEVAIISFPHMKQSQAFSESEFSLSRLTNNQIETRVPRTKELSVTTFGGNTQGHAFSESKVVVQEHGSSLQSPSLETAQRSSRVHVGRHEILIRPWPHPDPLQTVSAYYLMSKVQEEQGHAYGVMERKQLLIITPTCPGIPQVAGLTGLIHTLRLIRGPLLWIVVEAGNVSNETVTLLASSQLSFHHLIVQDASTNLKERLRTEGLRYIQEQHLEGIVVFAEEGITYLLNYFDEVQKVKWLGVFTTGFVSSSGICESAACEDARSLLTLVSSATNVSNTRISPQGRCNSSHHGVCWYSSMTESTYAGDTSSTRSSNWSAFAFNARLLWEDHKLPWIKSWRESFTGNETLVQSPLDLVRNVSQIEALGVCGRPLF